MIKRGKADRQAARKERLSAALRENLKRRKQQARVRATEGQGNPGEISPAKDAHAADAVAAFRRNLGDE